MLSLINGKLWPSSVNFMTTGDEGDGGAGGGSGNDELLGGVGSDPDLADHEARIADFQSQLKRSNDDALKLAERLHAKAYALRKRAQDAEAKIPKEGSLILDSEKAKVYDKYTSLGDPEQISVMLKEHELLKRGQEVGQVAQAAGWNPTVLATILPEGAEIGIEDAGDSENPIPYIKLNENNVPLSDWVKDNRVDFLPALANSEGSKGRQWIRQKPAEGTTNNGQVDLVAERLALRAKAQPEKPPF